MAKTPIEIGSLARDNSANALRVLVGIMNSKKAQPSSRVLAANAVLDRAHGKPAQYTETADVTNRVLNAKPLSDEDWRKQYDDGLKPDGTEPIKPNGNGKVHE